jgi:mono/diheme cytochrome c family protein
MRYACIGICGLIVLAVGIWQSHAGQKPKSEATKDAVKHGEYLVSRVALCGDCHTPQDNKGKQDHSRLLQGAELTFKPIKKTKDWADHSPDISSGGLAGEWTEAQMVKFLTTGLNPEGKKAAPPMPAFRLAESDARAVAVYLKSLSAKKGKDDKKSE